jgi:hypothetical protein
MQRGIKTGQPLARPLKTGLSILQAILRNNGAAHPIWLKGRS